MGPLDILKLIASYSQTVWINLALVDRPFRAWAYSEAGRLAFVRTFTTVEITRGAREWRLLGHLHRIGDRPARIIDGAKYWYRAGQRYRANGRPSVVYRGRREWWTGDRLVGPTVAGVVGPGIIIDGAQLWYEYGTATHTYAMTQHGYPVERGRNILHRDGGPAVVDVRGAEYWQHGRRV